MTTSTHDLRQAALDGGLLRSRAGSPLLWLVLVCAVLLGLLSLRLTLPIGPMYWDLYIYFDAANRIFDGQVPSLDFFAPVGPLGYWLFALFVEIFPRAQPLLLVQWSLLLVTAPILALVLADIDRRSRPTALALLVPYLVFQILPINVEQFSIYPGVDGYGIYNRQMTELLYVLTAALIFVHGRRTMFVAVTGTMLALFMVKITGFAGGVVLCLFAFAAGRIALRTALLSAVLFFAALLVLQLTTGFVTAYFGDIFQLLQINEAGLVPRLLLAASVQFSIFGPLLALTLFVFSVSLPDTVSALRALTGDFSFDTVHRLFDRDAFWLATSVASGLFIESQNTGGQAFIFVWPIMLRLLLTNGVGTSLRQMGVATLVAASFLPSLVGVSAHAARALVGQVNYVVLDRPDLKTLGAVTQRAEFFERARFDIASYVRFPETWRYFAENEKLPAFTLYSEPSFQLTWLLAADEAVKAIRSYEKTHDVRFETIMNLNFVNPFPWLLDRHAPHAIAIGADVFRAVPKPTAKVLAAVAGADLVLYPNCPQTNANLTLLELYTPGLSGHKRISLSPCWDAFVRNPLLAVSR